MGQVGLPALYSPGQSNVKAPTAATLSRAANLHRANQGIEVFAKQWVLRHRLQIEILQMNILEWIPRVEQEDLEIVPGNALGHAIHLGIAHLGNIRLTEQSIEPHVLGAQLLRRLQGNVERQV